MRITVTDASPLHYLILINVEFILELLYERVIVPAEVASELRAAGAPPIVRRWMEEPPRWIEMLPPLSGFDSGHIAPLLDAGEAEAISVALSLEAELLLMDERAGVREARSLGLTVTGTLGVLTAAGELDLIDIQSVLAQLLQTNFRVPRQLIREILAADAQQRRPS